MLARWEADPCGYPCKLIWAEQEHICEDRTALEICLAGFLRDPIVGQRLYGVMNLTPGKDDTEPVQAGDERGVPEDDTDVPPEEPAP